MLTAETADFLLIPWGCKVNGPILGGFCAMRGTEFSDQNARGQCNLTEKWQQILVGREYERRKKSVGQPKKNVLRADDILSERICEAMAKEHGISKASVERYGARSRMYDLIEEEYGKDSDEARAAMTAAT